MAGFFKKLFNRITGKPAEEAAPIGVEQVALPAPEFEPAVAASKAKKPKPPLKAQPDAPVKTPEAHKAPKKPAPKIKAKIAKAEPKKSSAKKPAVKIVVAKKPEPKKPAAPKKQALAPVVKVKLKLEQQHPAPKPAAEIVKAPSLPTPPVAPMVPAPAAEPSARGGWFSRLKDGLSKSSKSISGSITSIFTKRKLDKETLQELEDTLIQADLGVAVSERIIAAVSHGRYDKEIDPEEVKQILASEIAKVLKPVEMPFNFGTEKPFVILVVGVNGSGKTTTIGKLGSIAAAEGFKVMFAACDTFRAAAVEQLTVWGKRIGAPTKSAAIGADAAGLAFDALKQAREDGTDILFIDTAGRLQNKSYLMDELDKVVRVIKKMDADAPHAVLLVLDATTGQNALAQADVFTQVAGVTGLIMTKLDGTARGGILVAIAEKFKLPIHAIGVGESIDDLQPFDAQAFARAIAGFENQ